MKTLPPPPKFQSPCGVCRLNGERPRSFHLPIRRTIRRRSCNDYRDETWRYVGTDQFHRNTTINHFIEA